MAIKGTGAINGQDKGIKADLKVAILNNRGHTRT